MIFGNTTCKYVSLRLCNTLPFHSVFECQTMRTAGCSVSYPAVKKGADRTDKGAFPGTLPLHMTSLSNLISDPQTHANIYSG